MVGLLNEQHLAAGDGQHGIHLGPGSSVERAIFFAQPHQACGLVGEVLLHPGLAIDLGLDPLGARLNRSGVGDQ